MGEARCRLLHAHPLRGLERGDKGDAQGRGHRAVPRIHLGGPADPVLHRQRAPRPGDKGVPGSHRGHVRWGEGPQRPAHPTMKGSTCTCLQPPQQHNPFVVYNGRVSVVRYRFQVFTVPCSLLGFYVRFFTIFCLWSYGEEGSMFIIIVI